MEDHEDTLRKLAIRDDAYIDRVLGNDRRNLDESSLDEKTHALVRLAGLIAIDAAPPSYMWTVESALAHGATNEEIVGVLVAVMPAVGSPRVVFGGTEAEPRARLRRRGRPRGVRGGAAVLTSGQSA